MKVIVSQNGSRRHYLVPRALHGHGMLAGLVTNWYTPDLSGVMKGLLQRWGGKGIRRALGRRAEAIPDEMVRSCNLKSLAWTFCGRIYARRGVEHAGHLFMDRAFASWVARQNLPPHDVFFGYSYASLEALRAEKERGVFTILDQIDAAEVHALLAREEAKKWPDYATAPAPILKAYFDRVKQEWDVADLIIANSEWTKKALIDQGVSSTKIEVNMLAYDMPQAKMNLERPTWELPLRVLWVGNVNVAKGIQYLVEAARALEGKPVEFTIAGPLLIKPEAINAAPRNIKWLGQVPRSEVGRLYQSHHIFVLPTISDGFAITQLEALFHGLPVIVTPNCGRVVQDGETGFVIPPFSSNALAEAIMHFLEDQSLLNRMSPKCVKAANTYSVDAYASRLIHIIQSRLGASE